MTFYLLRYPHPLLPDVWIYCGQDRGISSKGRTTDDGHRRFLTNFGKRFQERFPGMELPQPVRERVEAKSHKDFNDLLTIKMFRYHTWCGYEHGMNVALPYSSHYAGGRKKSAGQ